jgi:teichuronic acid biosynthesis glycosyltransferase TuaC
MHILIVCKANFEPSELNFQKNKAFIYDQVQELKRQNVSVDLFFLQGRGIKSYLKGVFKLRTFLKTHYYDLVHAHYGYSGLVAGIVSKYPVVVTYHGTDITERISNAISFFSILLADWNIFVSRNLMEKLIRKPRSRFSIIPCGVDLEIFYPKEKYYAMMELNWHGNRKKVLFSSSFKNPIKNVDLAKKSLDMFERKDIEFIEIKDKTRKEVALMLNACDVLLLTSYSEGSPQIIKEAMACNCPIVATDVGDIQEVVGNAKNCFLTDFDPREIFSKISLVFSKQERSNGKSFVEEFSNKRISSKIIRIYKEMLSDFTSK